MKRHCVGLLAFASICVSFLYAQTPAEFKAKDGLINAVAISDDGAILAGACFDGTVKLWDFKSGKELQVLKGHGNPVNGVAFNKDGSIVASCSQDKTIRLWNPKDGKSIKELKGHTDGVSWIAFSPDGKQLASASSDKSVRLWNVADGKELKKLGDHKESVYYVAFNKDGSQLASCGNDGVITIWDVKGFKAIKSMMVDLPKPEVKIEPKKVEKKEEKGKKDTKKKVVKKEEPKELRDAFHVVAFTPDGKQVLSAGADKFLRYWNLADGKEAKKIGPTPDWILGMAVSKDGKQVATAGYGGSLRVYELASGKLVFPDAKSTKAADAQRKGWITYCAAFSADGKAVVTSGEIRGVGGVVKVTTVGK